MNQKTTVNNIALAKRLYPEYNAKYFDSECPPGLFIGEKALGKDILAMAPFTSNVVDGIFFNSRYELPDDRIKSLLLHEMIHVWLISSEIYTTSGGGYHGKEFQDKRKEVESESGISIPETEEGAGFSSKTLSKPVYGLYMKYQGRNSVLLVSEKATKPNNLHVLVSWAESLAKRWQAKEAFIFKAVGIANLYHVVPTYNLDEPKFHSLNKEDVDEIKEKSEILRQIR